MKTALQTKKVTYDEIAQRLLAELNIEPKLHSTETVFSQLDIFRGRITIINYKVLFNIVPVYQQYASLIFPEAKEKECLQEELEQLKSKHKTRESQNAIKYLSKKIAALDLHLKKIISAMEAFGALKEIFPTGIGFELKMSDDSVFTGNLKSEYLVDTEEIVFSNYGDILPDVWNILGIVDYKTTSTLGISGTFISSMRYASNQLKTVLSGSDSKGTIIPILIYRELFVAWISLGCQWGWEIKIRQIFYNNGNRNAPYEPHNRLLMGGGAKVPRTPFKIDFAKSLLQ